jgi:hypothetical protein
MATDDPIRASDVDREAVVGALREAYMAGRLTIEEFDERMTAAYAARTWGDLRQLTIDLPTQPILGSDVPGRGLPRPMALPTHPSRPEHVLVPEPQEPDEPDVLAGQGDDAQLQPQRRRGSPVGLLIPAAIWILIVAHAPAGAGIAFVIMAVVAMMAIMSVLRRR